LQIMETTEEPWIIDFSELVVGIHIGSGGYGEVYKGVWRGTDVAVKVLKSDLSTEDIKIFYQEVQLLSRLRHPNVILFLGACFKLENLCSISVYEERGSLHKVLRTKLDLKWKLLLRMAIDAARGMTYLHLCKPPIIHRDLKSMNLLVSENFSIKVADFGLSKLHNSNQNSKMGTLNWLAPEVLSELVPYGLEADVFSFGMILWEILTRDTPYSGMNPLQIVRLIDRGERPAIPANCPANYRELITECWVEDFTRRPTFLNVLSRLKKNVC